MQDYWLILGVLCVWRIAHLFQAEDGPWNIIAQLRHLAGNGLVGGLLDCFYCLSLWIAAPLACVLGVNWKQRLLLWPALSAGAILAERLTKRQQEPETTEPTYFDLPEDHHVMLRQQ